MFNKKQDLKQWALSPEDWYLSGDENKKYNLDEIDENLFFNRTFYKDRWINENGLSQHLVVTFSPNDMRKICAMSKK